jgi:gamma-glutamylaminecyclotransferase
MRVRARTVASGRPRAQESRANPAVGTVQPYLFAYGTLKRGGKFHSEIAKDRGVKYVGEARIRGELYQIRGADFPGAVPTSQPNRYVAGQLFLMRHPRETLTALDEFEGVDEGLFRRELVEVRINDKPLKAWVYFYARSVEHSNLLQVGVYSSE